MEELRRRAPGGRKSSTSIGDSRCSASGWSTTWSSRPVSSVAADRPLMRPLFFDWPRDTMIWQYPMQYLLGDDLLVAPVVEPGADRWDVYLPDGEWVDAWASSSLPGGQVVTVSAPLDRIPVFVRAAVAERHLPRFQALPA